jgi:hypothetical protein
MNNEVVVVIILLPDTGFVTQLCFAWRKAAYQEHLFEGTEG